MVAANGSVAICPRTETGAAKYLDGSGYLHILDKSAPIPTKKDECGEELPEHNLVLSSLASKMMAACDDSRAERLGENLGVSRLSLRLLRVGWSSTSDAFSFPMWRSGSRVIGIRLRSMNGKKWAIKGSRQGLFMPIEWINKRNGVVICEGPTDTAAMMTLGFNAIGRPSALGSHALVEEAVCGKSVCIISDSDKVGLDSSQRLCRHLKSSHECKRVGILVPPNKDAREWIRCGATRSEVADAIAEAMRCDGPYHCQ